MKYELKLIRIWSFIKVSFFVNLVVGFVLGIFAALFMPLFMVGLMDYGGRYGGGVAPSDLPLGMMLVMFPIMGAMFAAVFHTMVGIVLIAVYNLVARAVGGLEMRLELSEAAPVEKQERPITTQAVLAPETVARPDTPPPPPPAVPGLSAREPSPERESSLPEEPAPAAPISQGLEERLSEPPPPTDDSAPRTEPTPAWPLPSTDEPARTDMPAAPERTVSESPSEKPEDAPNEKLPGSHVDGTGDDDKPDPGEPPEERQP